jgi:hypothetical protein
MTALPRCRPDAEIGAQDAVTRLGLPSRCEAIVFAMND